MTNLERVEELEASNLKVAQECMGLYRRITRLEQENTKLKRENEILSLKSRIIDRLPFCPDHRDKVAGKPCRECEVDRLQRRLDAATELINEIRPKKSICHEYDETCWACRAVAWLEDKQDG